MKSKRKKEKSLKPSARENKKYLLLENQEIPHKFGISGPRKSIKDFRGETKEEVEKAILDYVGILGYSKASPVFIGKNILAVNRKEVDKIKASLLLAGINVRRVSGTINGLRG